MKLYIKSLSFMTFIIVILSGCGSSKQNIYSWDRSYIDSVYQTINEEGDINEQISEIEKFIQKTDTNNKKVAPGLYAHLGLLYSKIGNNTKARMYLEKEKKAFPEANQYINFLKKKGVK